MKFKDFLENLFPKKLNLFKVKPQTKFVSPMKNPFKK